MIVKPLVIAVVLLSVALGQIIPGCGDSSSDTGILIGWVDRKYVEPAREFGGGLIYMLDINFRPYTVPRVFWNEVDVGDKVMFDGKKWVILKKAR